MSSPLRVVHYVNQFFGGIGGEDQAHVGVTVKAGAVGPGRVLETARQSEAIDLTGIQIEASCNRTRDSAEAALHESHVRIQGVIEIENDRRHYREPPARASCVTAAAARNAPRPSINRCPIRAMCRRIASSVRSSAHCAATDCAVTRPRVTPRATPRLTNAITVGRCAFTTGTPTAATPCAHAS